MNTRDRYASFGNPADRLARTAAQAEGALQGSASSYRVAGPFETNWTYSRFDAVRARPRDIGQMAKQMDQRATHALLAKFNTSATAFANIPHLNFQGVDIAGLARPRSVMDCRQACVAKPECLAFTFIANDKKKRKLCWLKGQGYQAMTGNSEGTISGVVRRRPERHA